MKTLGFTLALTALLVVPASALAAQQDFTIHNQTGFVVVTLNVSPSSENRWGPDILGGEVLANGEEAAVAFDREDSECLWDIRVTYEDGDSGEWRQTNLCETDRVTLNGG